MSNKVIVIADIHIGCRSDSKVFDDYLNSFFFDFFWPLVDKVKPRAVLNAGDTFDRRKYINFNILDNSSAYYFKEADKRVVDDNIRHHIILGNHDVFYKNTNAINSPELLMRGYSNLDIYSEPEDIVIGDRKFLMFPWVPANVDKEYEYFEKLQASDADVVLAHIDVNSFDMGYGVPITAGFDLDFFSKFKLAMSGHIHKKQSIGNFHYLGNPYEKEWGDYNQLKGVHILDLDTLELEFVRNPNKMFHKILYNEDSHKIDMSVFKGKYVQVVVKRTNINVKFEKFMERLADYEPANVQIKEFDSGADPSDDANSDFEVESTLVIIEKYIRKSGIDEVSNGALLNYTTDLYTDAINYDIE